MALKSKFIKAARGESVLGFDPMANDQPRLSEIRIADIEADAAQPRKDLGDLDGLVQSVREHGILQPLVVSPVDETRYRIIAGERRFTAATRAGLSTVPALVRTVKDHNRIELQLVENLHRKDLDAFEESSGYHRLAEEFNLRHEDIARRAGKSRTHVTQMLAVARISPDIRERCRDARVTRETLFLIAKQDTAAAMLTVLDTALKGGSKDEQREVARKRPARNEETHAETPAKKPKMAYSTGHRATVIVQALGDTLTSEQIVRALEEALAKARNGSDEPMSGV